MRTLFFAAAFALSAHALAQDSVKPELMLILDTSHEMERLSDGVSFPVCSDSSASGPEEGVTYSQNRMSIVQDALGGSRSVSWCVTDDRSGHQLGTDGTMPHFRPMCCADTDCNAWVACGHDTDCEDGSSSVAAIGTGFAADGFIYTHRSDLRFTLMTLDAMPGPAGNTQSRAAQGHYSYGASVSVGSAEALNAFFTEDKGVTSANLGIRNDSASSGGLIAHNVGLSSSAHSSSVGEQSSEIESHNVYVMDAIRRLVPFGRAALAPMLADAVTYVEEMKNADSLSCRPRVAVLITQGEPGWFFDRAGCDGCSADQCVQIWNDDRSEQFSVCRANHQEGYPYNQSSVYAKKLRQAGVPLFVIAVGASSDGENYCKSVAKEGSPNLGIDGSAGCLVANDVISLRNALERVANSVVSGNRTQTRSLIITPKEGDNEGSDDIRQWRFDSFTEIPAEGDEGHYGHVEQQRLGCDATRADADAPGALLPFTVRKYDQLLENLSVRRVVAESYENAGLPVAVMGSNSGAFFNQTDGLGGAMSMSSMLSLTHQESETALKAMVMTLNGYFGQRGRPEGALTSSALRKRQLGAILSGEMVAVQPPATGVETAAVQAYELQNQHRPTIVVQGAQDGLVHFFRADSGLELFSFMPKNAVTSYGSAFNAEGLMDTGVVALCRNLGSSGTSACPSGTQNTPLRTLVVGAVAESSNIYALQLDALGKTSEAYDNITVNNWNPSLYFPTNAIWNVTAADESKLGLTVSRPRLTQVRVNDEVKGAVIVGCGADPNLETANKDDANAKGRCVLVLDASDGSLIHRFTNNSHMKRPMVGSPAIWPGDALATAEQVYMGDAVGHLWRLDLTDKNPDNWTSEIIWPSEGATYQVGRAFAERPSLIETDTGDKVILFGTSSEGDGSLNDSFIVSLTERKRVNVNTEENTTTVSENWTFPLAEGEALVGATVIREGVAYFTTAQLVEDNSCASSIGRLFGVDAWHVNVDSDGNASYYTRQSKSVDVLPKLVLSGAAYNALSVVLPEGRLAYGVSLVTSPSCTDGDEVSTDIILDLDNQSQVASQAVDTSALQIEQVGASGVQSESLSGRMYAEGGTRALTLSSDRDQNGQALEHTSSIDGPFPSMTTYWGSVLSE